MIQYSDDYPRNKALVASERYGFMALLTSLLDFATDENVRWLTTNPPPTKSYPRAMLTLRGVPHIASTRKAKRSP